MFTFDGIYIGENDVQIWGSRRKVQLNRKDVKEIIARQGLLSKRPRAQMILGLFMLACVFVFLGMTADVLEEASLEMGLALFASFLTWAPIGAWFVYSSYLEGLTVIVKTSNRKYQIKTRLHNEIESIKCTLKKLMKSSEMQININW